MNTKRSETNVVNGSFFSIHYYYVFVFFFLVKQFEPAFNNGEMGYTNQFIVVVVK